MLQQTGVERVREAYAGFLRSFPSLRTLASASVRDVLAAWKGLGYNRRALSLARAARIIVDEHGGRVPRSSAALEALPGVGHATACAILAYAFNQPCAFIETNVRRVFLHFFFPGERGIRDCEILPLVERTLDRTDPRDWYDALMDYGTMLRSKVDDATTHSARYRRQKPFAGSVRQARGLVLGALLRTRSLDREGLAATTGVTGSRLDTAVDQLEAEGFLTRARGRLSIRSGNPPR